MEINLVLPPKTYDPPSHHPEPAGFSVTWEDAASDSFIGKQCLLPNFWPSSRLLGFVYLFLEWCVCCVWVCFVCFLRLYPPLLASYFMRDT